MKTSSTFFFLTSNAGRFVSSGTMLLVKSSENWMGFDTRNVKTRTMKRWIVLWMQAHTMSTTNWHAMFSLKTKLDTGMSLLKNKVKSFYEFWNTLILNTSSMGHMTRVKWLYWKTDLILNLILEYVICCLHIIRFLYCLKQKSIDCTIIIPIRIVKIWFLWRSSLYSIVYVSSTFIWRCTCL